MVAVVKPKFKYDDALDAFGVHGIGGIVGSILTGVFATQYITGEGGVARCTLRRLASVVDTDCRNSRIDRVQCGNHFRSLQGSRFTGSVSVSTDEWKKKDLTSTNTANPPTTL